MKKLVHKKTHEFMGKQKLLHEHKYSFWNKHFTNYAIIDISEKKDQH